MRAARAKAIVGIDETDAGPASELRKDSDALLQAARELHDLELEKRRQEISTPEFHDKAHEITVRSRDVFRIAADEERVGDEIESPQHTTTDDVRPQSGPGNPR
jgi:hypothetical protein